MNFSTYGFVDGKYFSLVYERSFTAIYDRPTRPDFAHLFSNHRCERVFYYDCVEYKRRDSETEEQRDLRIAPRLDSLKQIEAMPGVRVREGTVKGKGGKKEPPRQKQVDTMLSVDMLTHALHKNIAGVVLVAGDLDFLPAVESLVRAGVYVRLMGERTHTAIELIDEADEFLELDYNELINWTHGLLPEDKYQKTVRYETKGYEQSNPQQRGKMIATKDGQELFTLQVFGNYYLLVKGQDVMGGATSSDAAITARWLEHRFAGKIQWT